MDFTVSGFKTPNKIHLILKNYKSSNQLPKEIADRKLNVFTYLKRKLIDLIVFRIENLFMINKKKPDLEKSGCLLIVPFKTKVLTVTV